MNRMKLSFNLAAVLAALIVVQQPLLDANARNCQNCSEASYDDRQSPDWSNEHCRQGRCIRDDPLVGWWNIQQSEGVPIDLSGEGVMSIHAEGTLTVAFDYYLGTELNASSFLVSPGLGTWRKIGHNKYQLFVSTIIAKPTPYPDSESGPYGVFPTNLLFRVLVAQRLSFSAMGIPLSASLPKQIAQITCLTTYALRIRFPRHAVKGKW